MSRDKCLACLLLFSFWWPIDARVLIIGPQSQYTQLSNLNGSIMPGDTVLIKNGLYQSGTQFLEDWIGRVHQPIVIMAETPGQVIFRGGTEAIHLSKCQQVIISGLVVERQTGNGINIDDGGIYTRPSTHIRVSSCTFRDIQGSGNHDLLKLSGVDSFMVDHCTFERGSPGGSGIDMVGCHHGRIEDNYFDQAGVSGIQVKGGSQHVVITRNLLKNMSQRALNLGGSTGLEFFRPPLVFPLRNAFEAADIFVHSNLFIGSWSPVAYVGCVRVQVVNNTFYQPLNWVIRILQETTTEGFIPCGQNLFQNNIVYLNKDLTEVNIGPNTDPASFRFTHNLWYNAASSTWRPALPVQDEHEIVAHPLFIYPDQLDFQIAANSPANGNGWPENAPLLDYLGNPFKVPPAIGAFNAVSITSQSSVTSADHFLYYPHPAQDHLFLQATPGKYQLNMSTLNGQIIMRMTLALPGRLDLSLLPSSLYWVQLTAQGEIPVLNKTFLLIKQ